ncbi:MAG: hypothetical protein ACRBFS_02660 [Aureispira sp.]
MKNTTLIGTLLQYFIAISLIISGLLKIIGFQPYQEVIADLSPYYLQYIYLLGGIAILAGVLFILPKTFILGFLLTLVFLGGTISAHMQHGDSFIPQIIFTILTVLAVYLKNKTWLFRPISEPITTL